MPRPASGERCLSCRLPLQPEEREAQLARVPVDIRDWALCPACGLRADTVPRIPAIPRRSSPSERRLFDVEPENRRGLVITADRRKNRAQVLVWDADFVRRDLWTMRWSDLNACLHLLDEK